MKTYNITTPYATYNNCTLDFTSYYNKRLAIEINCEDGEPFATLTVNLPDEPEPKANQAYVDTNNCPWAMDFIKENNLGRDTGAVGFSGYCVYPLVEFNVSD